MSRPDGLFIEKLTKSQVRSLEELRDNSAKRRTRQRAHALLLSFGGMTVNELAKVFQCNRNTVSGWLNRWQTERIDGLDDKQRPGAPTKLDDQEKIRAIELLEQTPQSANSALLALEKETGKTISIDTLKRLAKKKDLVWKRMRKSLRSKRDQKKFATSK